MPAPLLPQVSDQSPEGSGRFARIYHRSLAEPEAFWTEAASGIDWIEPWTHDVTFNTNNVNTTPPISTGAKDGANLTAIQALAPIARRMGIETFVLDDGWQAASGDWYPDSPSHPEPRGKFPRYYQILLAVKSMEDTPIEIIYMFHKELGLAVR